MDIVQPVGHCDKLLVGKLLGPGGLLAHPIHDCAGRDFGLVATNHEQLALRIRSLGNRSARRRRGGISCGAKFWFRHNEV